MNKKAININYFELGLSALTNALNYLKRFNKNNLDSEFVPELPREIKSNIDFELNAIITNTLKESYLSIISEENQDNIDFFENQEKVWIVDPLDGTLNFMRGLPFSTVSISLFSGVNPLLSFIGVIPGYKIAMINKNGQAIYAGSEIEVSKINKFDESVLCTGIPSRQELNSKENLIFINNFKKFNKVRMLGSASYSLLQLAKGNVDYYYEREIMIWDIAAGIAIVKAAGGHYKLSKGLNKNSLIVSANNAKLQNLYDN